VPAAISWLWTFEGGTPATSTAQNPTVTYTADGSYDVTLVATNTFGVDTITKPDYISVVSGAACPSCSTTTNSTVVPISTGSGGQVYTSIINIPSGGNITDVNVTIDVTHTWDGDLDITLTSPVNTIVELSTGNGGSGDNYTNTVFDMDGANGPITGGTSPFTGSFIPEGDLSTFNGQDPLGDWTLTITDTANGDGGQLNFWSVEICLDATASVDEYDFDAFSIFPNPNNGEFTIELNSSSNKDIKVQVYDVRGRSVFDKSYLKVTEFNQTIKLNNVQSGMYLVKVSDGEKETIQKILIE
jgi:subtilisin-like proprotein convertase family protein